MAQKLTKSFIDALPFATAGQQTVMDTQTPGFGIRVGTKSKVFIVVKRLPHSAPTRVTLGKYGALTVETARKMAVETLGKLSSGVNLNAQKRAVKEEREAVKAAEEARATKDTETLGWLFNEYKEKQLIGAKAKPSAATLRSFGYTIDMFSERRCPTLRPGAQKGTWEEDKLVVLESWLDRPLRSITTDEVLARFEVMEKTRPKILVGNKLAPMKRTHQITYSLALCAYDWFIPRNYHATHKIELLENPFNILNVFKKWKPASARTRIVDSYDNAEFGKWWKALQDYREINEVAADYIEYSILQGGRSIEVVPLSWDSVDLEKMRVLYENTKNGEQYVVPITNRVKEILQRRLKNNPKNNKWVWAYPNTESGHVPTNMTNHFNKLTHLGGKYVSSHDLKRTWATTAHSFTQFRERDINYLLKHKEGDVNRHYFIKTEETLRSILQTVEDHFVAQGEKYMSSLNS